MRAKLIIVYCSLITSFLFLLSCSPPAPTSELQSPLQTSFYLYRFNPPALVEFNEDFQLVKETSFAIPPNCGLFNIFSPPVGKFLAIELNCPNGQTVLYMDVETAAVIQPVTDTDSHFLAWTTDGTAAYLKVDSLGQARVVRASVEGKQEVIPISEFTYDLAPSRNRGEFTFSFSRGLGQGSELWLAKRDGDSAEQLYADAFHYVSFARWSPDGSQIAFIKIPDSQIPFTVGELWVMNVDGSDARKLADADTGHGYAANWSPDGTKIAFVKRENPEDEHADQSSDALISNINMVEVESGRLTKITNITDGRVETPLWSPGGNTLSFNVVINGRMIVHSVDIITGRMWPLITESTCCPAWMRK